MHGLKALLSLALVAAVATSSPVPSPASEEVRNTMAEIHTNVESLLKSLENGAESNAQNIKDKLSHLHNKVESLMRSIA
jgi:ElaB/YqjD/DUF883 family membrane-anchored ribosome-binding protein